MKRLLLLSVAILTLLRLNAELTASILTASPGSEIYELDGHTGLRLSDPDRGIDMVVNWGVFDFAAPNFVYRFVKGETDYICAAVPTRYFIDSYTRQGRSVTEQTVALTPAQAERLLSLVSLNLMEANRVYRYSYIHDNCATRPLIMLELAMGRTLVPDSIPSPRTFREEMRANHAAYPWYQFGIDLALGSGLDQPITTRQLAFSPLQLRALLDKDDAVTVTAVHGEESPVHSPTPFWLSPMAVAILVLVVALAVTICDLRRRKLSRWFDTLLYSILGLCGCVIAFLVLISTHSATSPNWLLLFINPFCLLGAILPWIKSSKKWLISYHFVNFAVLILGSVLWPLTGQVVNTAIIPWLAADLIRSATNVYICRKN